MHWREEGFQSRLFFGQEQFGAGEGLTHGTGLKNLKNLDRATMNGSSTVLEHERRNDEQERLHCHLHIVGMHCLSTSTFSVFLRIPNTWYALYLPDDEVAWTKSPKHK